MGPETEPDDATRAAERAEAGHPHTADRPPTAEEVAAADFEYFASDPDEREAVSEHEEEMANLGANIKGEGQIE
jgi:hypothetical protein